MMCYVLLGDIVLLDEYKSNIKNKNKRKIKRVKKKNWIVVREVEDLL